jgi:hypothetical protein
MLFVMSLSGCVYVDMNVENKPTPGLDFSSVHTFAFKKADDSKSALESVLLATARAELEAKGFSYDSENPDFLVLLNFGSKSVIERGVTYSRDVNKYDLLHNTYANIGVVKTGDESRNDNTVRVYMVTPHNEGMRTYLWRGSATSQDQEGLGVVGKCLVKGALLKFPAASGSFREKISVGDCE